MIKKSASSAKSEAGRTPTPEMSAKRFLIVSGLLSLGLLVLVSLALYLDPTFGSIDSNRLPAGVLVLEVLCWAGTALGLGAVMSWRAHAPTSSWLLALIFVVSFLAAWTLAIFGDSEPIFAAIEAVIVCGILVGIAAAIVTRSGRVSLLSAFATMSLTFPISVTVPFPLQVDTVPAPVQHVHTWPFVLAWASVFAIGGLVLARNTRIRTGETA